jgi:hypothetical protein
MKKKQNFFKINRENVQWQATCNSFGIGVGNFIGNAAFLVFESTDFSNKYIRPVFNLSPKPHGIITVECNFFFHNLIIFILIKFIIGFCFNIN